MKKFLAMTLGVAMLSTAALAGCDWFGPKEDTRTMLTAPTCTIYDNYIRWSPIENAVGYVVSVNGVEQAMQENCDYTVNTDEEVSVKVKAIAEESSKDYKNSEYGSSVVRQADPKYEDALTDEDLQALANTHDEGSDMYMIDLPATSEAYSLSFSESTAIYAILVPEEVRLIHVVTDEEGATVNFVLETRATPFILELAGAALTARDDNSVINASASAVASGMNIIVRSLTEENAGAPTNSLTGGNSTKVGSKGKGGNFVSGGGKGGTGGAGLDAIVAENVLFCGNASVVLTGGKGATGGAGGDNSANLGGDGGNGGKGGSAVSGKAYINIPNRLVSLLGGAGGAGGAKGKSTNLFASPSAGKAGATGGSAADIIVFNGEVKK